MGTREDWWHGEWVVEVGEGAGWELGASVENGLSEFFDFGFLCVGGFGPDKVVVDE